MIYVGLFLGGYLLGVAMCAFGLWVLLQPLVRWVDRLIVMYEAELERARVQLEGADG